MKNELVERKNKVANLIDRLRTTELSEEQQDKIIGQLDDIISDPKWMDYIYWSDDYIRPDGSFYHDKFFKKISDYENSDEYQRHEYIISLLNQLLQKDFKNKDEMQIVNELNGILNTTDWIDAVFVSKVCLHDDGTLYRNAFLKMFCL